MSRVVDGVLSEGTVGGGGGGPRGGGGRAGELVDQHGAGDPAPLAALDAAAQRHVVGNDDRLDRNAFGAREFGGKPEIEPVARVVLHDQQRAVRAGAGTDRGEYGRTTKSAGT